MKKEPGTELRLTALSDEEVAKLAKPKKCKCAFASRMHKEVAVNAEKVLAERQGK